MRTMQEIVSAVRLNEEVTTDELRYALVAFDVMLAQVNLDKHQEVLFEYMRAGEIDAAQYVGKANSPDNPEAVEWYRAFHSVSANLH